MTDSLNCLAYFDTLVQFRNISGSRVQFTSADVHCSCRAIKGISLGTTRKLKPELIRPYAQQTLSTFASVQFTLDIDKIVNLDEIVEIHQHHGKNINKCKCKLSRHFKT